MSSVVRQSLKAEKKPAAKKEVPLPKPEKMMRVEAQEVFLLPDSVKVTIGGVDKFISYSSFIDTLRKHVERDSVDEMGSVKGSSLPPNCTWLGKSSSVMELNFYYPERVRTITYYDSKMEVTIPNVILYHRLVSTSDGEYTVSLSKYFCTDLTGDRVPKELINGIDHGKRIFLFPFSNTYDHAGMCFGNNSMPRIIKKANLRELNWYYEYLFNSPFNDDLGIEAAKGRPAVRNWYSDLAAAAKAGTGFPYERLSGFKAV